MDLTKTSSLSEVLTIGRNKCSITIIIARKAKSVIDHQDSRQYGYVITLGNSCPPNIYINDHAHTHTYTHTHTHSLNTHTHSIHINTHVHTYTLYMYTLSNKHTCTHTRTQHIQVYFVSSLMVPTKPSRLKWVVHTLDSMVVFWQQL